MRLLRLVAAILLLGYVALNAVTVGAFAAFKLGFSIPLAFPIEVFDLMAATSWAQLGLIAVIAALYLIVSIKLMRRAKAFVFWAVAFVLDVGNLLWNRSNEAYQAVSDAGPNADYAIVMVNLVIGALILWLGRTHLD
ncbi:MAG: hypothetical protein PVI23_04540 [Maricaulaceae bacterium]|jgi:hypothetical protein